MRAALVCVPYGHENHSRKEMEFTNNQEMMNESVIPLKGIKLPQKRNYRSIQSFLNIKDGILRRHS